jgi:hypothetical protein
MKYKALLALSAAALLGSSALYAQQNQLSYNYIGAEYFEGDLLGEDFDGYGAELSLAISDSFFFTATGSKAENKDNRPFQQLFGKPELRNYTAGIGFHTPLTDRADFVTAVKYVQSDLKVGGRSFEADGFGVDAGIRTLLTPSFELEGIVKYINGDDFDEDFGYRANLRFYVTPAFSLSAGYFDGDQGDAADGLVAGVRFNF